MNTCLYCGKELKSKRNKFCDHSCSAKYNNARRHLSSETKEKISKTFTEKYGKIVEEKHLSHCVICGKEFVPYKLKNKRFSSTKTCSDECAHLLKILRSKESQEKLLKEGRHKGWQSRNIISYAEQFWINVLQNNNIEYQKEYYFGKYFLDFYIVKGDKQIDLEIDGKQHLYQERKQHDKERDEYLKNNNIIVYRIAWNNINNNDGKKEMQGKIDDFLAWYTNL